MNCVSGAKGSLLDTGHLNDINIFAREGHTDSNNKVSALPGRTKSLAMR